MNVREALETIPPRLFLSRGQLDKLASIIEKGLRAERKAGFLRAAEFYYDGGYSESVRLTSLDVEEEPVTAGVAAMVEES